MTFFKGPQFQTFEGKPRKLVVFLHGYGSSGHDLISLAPSWAAFLPDTLFLAPHAFHAFPQGYGEGYEWFGLPDLSPKTLEEGIAAAAPRLNSELDQLLTEYSLNTKDLALVGFSQGAMMALATGMSRSSPCAGIVAYSGVFVTPPELKMTTLSPVLIVHGDQDEVVPVFYAQTAEKDLRKRGVSVTSLVCQNTGHGIDQSGLKAGGDFLLPSPVFQRRRAALNSILKYQGDTE